MDNIAKKRNTKQKFILLDYLQKNSDKHLTVDEIYSGLLGENISQATIYRLLSSLANEGIIKKIHIDDTKPACYQYTKKECTHDEHFHFICNQCSNMFHFEDIAVNNLKHALKQNENFYLDTDKTIFYGLCPNCMKGEKNV